MTGLASRICCSIHECWPLTAARNCKMSFVLSVFPAPDSPLYHTQHQPSYQHHLVMAIFPRELGLPGSPLAFFFHLFKKRTFSYKWVLYVLSPNQHSQSIKGNIQHWLHWRHPFFIHHQTPETAVILTDVTNQARCENHTWAKHTVNSLLLLLLLSLLLPYCSGSEAGKVTVGNGHGRKQWQPAAGFMTNVTCGLSA